MSCPFNQLRYGAVLSYVQMALNVLIGLLYTPVMVRMLGKSEYGLYCTAASMISMLVLLSFGFGSSYVRYYSQYKVKGDKKSIDSLNGLFLMIFSVIGFVTLVCGILLTWNLELVFGGGLSPDEYKTARVLMVLLTVSLASSFPMSVFSTILNANERFIFLKSIHMLKSVLSPIASIVVLYVGYRSVGMVSVTLILTLLADVFLIYYVFFILKNRFTIGKLEKGLFASLFAYTFFIMVNQMVNQVNWNIGKIILGRYQGTAEVAVFAVAASLHVYFENFATSVSHVFRPRVHRIVNEAQGNMATLTRGLTEVFVRIGRLQFMILALVGSGFVIFGYYFIVQFWVGAEYEDSYYVALLLILPTAFYLIQVLGQEVQRAQNKHQFRSYVYLFMMLANVAMSITLSKRYGAIGAAVGTAVSVVLVDVLIMNIYYQLKCHVDVFHFWREILSMSLGLLAPVACGILMTFFLNLNQLWQFMLAGSVYVLVYAVSMWAFACNEYEKALIRSILQKIFR